MTTATTTSLHGRRLRRCAGFVAAAFVVSILLASAAGAVPSGEVRFTTPAGSTLSSGGSSTVFSVLTPNGAKCPGDTAHDAYHLDSYFLPKGASPTSVNFKGGLPSTGFGLISDGAYFGAINVAANTGAVMILPLHSSWTRLRTGTLFPNGEKSSVWETGIVCADTDGVVTNYWNGELRFVADAHDKRGFRWEVVRAGSAPTTTRVNVWVLAVALLCAALGVVVIRGRSRRARSEIGSR